MMLACSHLIVATEDVSRMTLFFKEAFALVPHFENEMFSEFVLPSHFRIAFFKPVGLSAKTFSTAGSRGASAFGVTVKDVDALYASLQDRLAGWGASTGGAPKDHPWGEKSFLLIDFDGNRWEVAQSPTQSGMLVNRE